MVSSVFQFLHSADIHLDSPLIGLTGVEGRIAERIRSAPRAAFEALVERAIEDKVDFLIIAGDLYDGTWRDYKTGLFFSEQMGRLNQARIPVYLLHGNHDAESQITKPLVLPENVSVFDTRKAETFQIEELNVALHGQSFRERAVTGQSGARLPQADRGCVQHRGSTHSTGRDGRARQLCAVHCAGTGGEGIRLLGAWPWIYHGWSKKHMRAYVNEFTFRLNAGNVKIDTKDRLASLFGGMRGKTITYAQLTS